MKKMLGDVKLDYRRITPFLENYFVEKTKNGILFPKKKIHFSKEVYRTIGLINGDGFLNKHKIYFYGKNLDLHEDFKKGILHIRKEVDFKNTVIEISNTPKTYIYKTLIAKTLIKQGGFEGNKLLNKKEVDLPKNFHAISEYLSGFFDTEGSFIEYSHLVIPTCTSINKEEIKLLLDSEVDFIITEALNNSTKKTVAGIGSVYYRVGIRQLRRSEEGKAILRKVAKEIPSLTMLAKKALLNVGIRSKVELKSIIVYPDRKIMNSVWWLKITKIEEVIKFLLIVNLTDELKKKRINDFVLNYITLNDLSTLRKFIKEKTLAG